MDKYYSVSLVLLLLAFLPSAEAAGIVDVYTSSTTYYTGDTVTIMFQAGYSTGVFGTAEIFVIGPAGSASAGTVSIETGRMYTFTLYGSAISFPGFYTVKVVVGLADDVWEGSASFQVVLRVPFDFSLTISPSVATVIRGGTAKYTVSATFSDPSYTGTPITLKVTDLDPSITSTVTPAGELSLKTTATTPPGTYVFTLSGTAQGITRQTTATLVVEPPFEYTLTVSPSSATVNTGEKAKFDVVISLAGGNPETVSLGLSGLPAEITYAFSPSSGTPTFTSTLTLDLAAVTLQGTHTFTVTAAGGGLTKTADVTLTIREKDFSLNVTPESTSLKQTETSTFRIDVKPIGGFDQEVALRVSGMPEGVTSKFSTTSAKPPYISVLSVEIGLSAKEGDYTLTIEAEGGGIAHTANISLKVEKKLFTISFSPSFTEKISPTDSILFAVLGTKPNVSGTLTPPLQGKKVTLLYQSPVEKTPLEELLSFIQKEGEGKTISREVTVGSDGSFADDLTAWTSGEWTVKAVLRDDGNVIAESGAQHFTIKTYPVVLILVVAVIIGAASRTVLNRRKTKQKAVSGLPKTLLYCPKCGASLTTGDLFCGSCGERIK
ncbi:hypothetical protein KEJ39_08220 [Candidatus Bathyarchaeota archaeon]|nr:hypothetical protein [Candidatus Bathyarchaeota archaeon]